MEWLDKAAEQHEALLAAFTDHTDGGFRVGESTVVHPDCCGQIQTALAPPGEFSADDCRREWTVTHEVSWPRCEPIEDAVSFEELVVEVDRVQRAMAAVAACGGGGWTATVVRDACTALMLQKKRGT